jgi:hypothetical protein
VAINYCWFVNELGGTADFIYSGADDDFHSPQVVGVEDGETYLYRAQSFDETVWEVGVGAYDAATLTFMRSNVLFNSDGDTSLIDFADPPHVVIQDYVTAGDPLATVDYVDAGDALLQGEIDALETEVATLLGADIVGLTLSTAGSSATFGIAAGKCANSTLAEMMVLASAYTKTTSAWAVGTGNGALDTGSIGNNTYHVFLIKRLDTNVVDILISLSATAPTLPANYTVFRRIGSMLTDGSGQWVAFVQRGDFFLWVLAKLDVNADTSVGITPALKTLSVPAGIIVESIVGVTISGSNANTGVVVSSPSAPITAGTPNPNLTTFANTAGHFGVADVRTLTNTSGQIYFSFNFASTNTLYAATKGWIDRRGRDG